MKNKMRKSITLILALAMIISVFATYPIMSSAASADDDKTKYKQFTTEQGSLVVEIENVVIDSSEVQIEPAKDASGRKHVRFLNTNTTQPVVDAPGFAGFEVTFDQPGNYTFHLRYVAPSSDSLWLDWGGVDYYGEKYNYLNVGLKPR